MSHASAVLDQLKLADEEDELPDELRPELERLEAEAEGDEVRTDGGPDHSLNGETGLRIVRPGGEITGLEPVVGVVLMVLITLVLAGLVLTVVA